MSDKVTRLREQLQEAQAQFARAETIEENISAHHAIERVKAELKAEEKPKSRVRTKPKANFEGGNFRFHVDEAEVNITIFGDDDAENLTIGIFSGNSRRRR
ncbi:hypothetical protein [Bradyrhizobium elkanii]|uniref:hypothetical protein n=1 Tax=Bradyrhizobium elkanii TaxID=29448 RepID=UPI003515E67A